VSFLLRTRTGLKLPDCHDNQTEKDLEQIQMFIKEVVFELMSVGILDKDGMYYQGNDLRNV
jgi:hypothetical protein